MAGSSVFTLVSAAESVQSASTLQANKIGLAMIQANEV